MYWLRMVDEMEGLRGGGEAQGVALQRSDFLGLIQD
jgi:hypothetical protein